LTRSRALGLLLTAVFLWLALRDLHPDELIAELRQVNYLWLLPSAALTLLSYVLRTARWGVILSGAARAPFGTLFAVLIMGFATNNLLPGRLGEVLRAYLLGKKRNVRKTYAIASVFVERVFDGLVLIALLGVVSRLVQLPAWGREVQVFSALVFLGATVVVAFLVARPKLAAVLVHRLASPLPARPRAWVDHVTDGFLDGLAVLRSPRVLASATALSVAVWLVEGASYYALSRGMDLGLRPGEGPPAMGLTLVMVNLGIMVPSAPGYVGTQEFFGTQALSVFGVPAERAFVLVFVSHAIQYLLVTGLGLLFFAREHVSFASLGAMVGRERGAAETESAV
jgi:uncharacterized protein (TIRG00374 family)